MNDIEKEILFNFVSTLGLISIFLVLLSIPFPYPFRVAITYIKGYADYPRILLHIIKYILGFIIVIAIIGGLIWGIVWLFINFTVPTLLGIIAIILLLILHKK